jgi:hypothetical protein
MITLNDPRLIFLKPHKVAGTSFEIALSKFATEDSIITPIIPEDEAIRSQMGFRSAQNYSYSPSELLAHQKQEGANRDGGIVTLKITKNALEISNRHKFKFYNHMSAREAKARLGTDVWNSYKRISIIRNPFDKMVSSYFFSNASKQALPPFEKWVMTISKNLPQNNSLYKINNRDVIQTYLRLDSMQEDVLALEQEHPKLKGLWNTFQGIQAKGQYRPKTSSAKELFKTAPAAKQLILDTHKEEIDRFNFKIP